jgi:hypothetical protein
VLVGVTRDRVESGEVAGIQRQGAVLAEPAAIVVDQHLDHRRQIGLGRLAHDQ